MSAEVIRFILPPHREARAPTDFPTIALRALVRRDDLATAPADTAPCELIPFEYDEP